MFHLIGSMHNESVCVLFCRKLNPVPRAQVIDRLLPHLVGTPGSLVHLYLKPKNYIKKKLTIKMIEMSQIRMIVSAPREWRHFFLLIRSPKSGWRFLTVFLILLWHFAIMNRYSLILINLLLQKKYQWQLLWWQRDAFRILTIRFIFTSFIVVFFFKELF